MANRQWAGNTFGNGWMHKHLIGILRHVDTRFIYLFAYLFVIPFCILFNKSRSFSYSFYRKRMLFNVPKSVVYTYVNHCKFAQVVIDRFAMYAGKQFDVEFEGNEHFQNLVSQPEGFIQLSSHIGNYEIAGYSLNSDKKTIHAIVFSNEKQSVMDNRNSMFAKTNVSMIELKDDMSHLFEIDKAVCNGDIISFPSDRHVGGSKCLEASFLGETALFPQGPFSVATMRQLNVIAVNVMKETSNKYKIYLTPLLYDKDAARRIQIQQLCNSYVKVLEDMVYRYPTQWYNLFDFWAK